MGKMAKWEAREMQLIQQQKQRGSPRTTTTRVTQVTQQEVKQAGEIISWLNLPWEPVFDSLELAASKEVALLSLQPNVASRAIRISGEAKICKGSLNMLKRWKGSLFLRMCTWSITGSGRTIPSARLTS